MSKLSEHQELMGDFLSEAGDMLDDVEVKLVELERNPNDGELLNAVFRGFHTIKGGAGFLEAAQLVELCHKGENLLDALRNRKITLTPEIMDVILAATGDVRRMFGLMSNGATLQAADAKLLAALERALHGEIASPPAAAIQLPTSGLQKQADGASIASLSEPNWEALYALVSGSGGTPEEDAGSAAASAPKRAPMVSAAKESSLRIDVARFDQILNLSGEIGLTKNRLLCLRQDIVRGRSDEATLKTLDMVVSQLDVLVSDLQNAVMKARMQPVGRVFQKYVRQARDLARQLGKEMELVLQGEDTELDKTLLDALNDSLMHLVRNAVDHGVESPAERLAAGKTGKAVVTLAARQVGDSIIIEVSDDGKGMRPEVLRQKAIEKGILGAHEADVLSDRDSFNLVFLPGFSTKSEVSDVSGRGVGMDVVRTNIQRLSGRIDISSEPGRGSRFTIVLPLTLAILPALMLRLGDQPFAIPLVSVREVINLNERDLQQVSGKATLVIRGAVLPVLRLADLLGWSSEHSPDVGVIVHVDNMEFILAVDSFVGRDDVIIKPLEAFKPKGVAGATLSREGVLVLVLDLRELIETLH
jgi:two-component system, chemotaxis family, sensor kinase CheA